MLVRPTAASGAEAAREDRDRQAGRVDGVGGLPDEAEKSAGSEVAPQERGRCGSSQTSTATDCG